MKKHIWTICFSAVLFAYTLYVVLDTFVIRRVYDANAVKVNTSMFATPLPSAASTALPSDPDDPEEETALPDVNTYVPTATAEPTPVQPYQDEDSYIDDNITIELSTYEEYGTAIYVADVRLSSAEYLKTAFAQNKYGRNITEFTSEIARTNGAILAVNGDYYGVQKKGFVIRNGVVYRDSARGEDVLCIYADGTFGIVSDNERTADELVESGVWQAFTFGPALIKEGAVTVDENDEVDMALASNPRTALGMIEPNHFVFVVSDGRTEESKGLSLYELAEFMKGLGVKTAYNLDGGGSSTMYFGGRVINKPTSGKTIKERKVSDIVYIGA